MVMSIISDIPIVPVRQHILHLPVLVLGRSINHFPGITLDPAAANVRASRRGLISRTMPREEV